MERRFRIIMEHEAQAIREVGGYLRLHGSGHHWIEKVGDEILIVPGSRDDVEILLHEFADMVEPAEA